MFTIWGKGLTLKLQQPRRKSSFLTNRHYPGGTWTELLKGGFYRDHVGVVGVFDHGLCRQKPEPVPEPSSYYLPRGAGKQYMQKSTKALGWVVCPLSWIPKNMFFH